MPCDSSQASAQQHGQVWLRAQPSIPCTQCGVLCWWWLLNMAQPLTPLHLCVAPYRKCLFVPSIVPCKYTYANCINGSAQQSPLRTCFTSPTTTSGGLWAHKHSTDCEHRQTQQKDNGEAHCTVHVLHSTPGKSLVSSRRNAHAFCSENGAYAVHNIGLALSSVLPQHRTHSGPVNFSILPSCLSLLPMSGDWSQT